MSSVNVLPWSEQTERLFDNDLITGRFDVDWNNFGCDVVGDSINTTNGKRLVTCAIKFPRIILAEVNTHRAASRNTSSSRAIPAKRTRELVAANPFTPVYWGANQRGMAAEQPLSPGKAKLAKLLWNNARRMMIATNWALDKIGLHKQIANRLIEPWMITTTVITLSEWDNLFNLRYNENAQPEFIVLARVIHDAIVNHQPVEVGKNGIHIPWIDDDEKRQWSIEQQIAVSTARSCRVSYNNILGSKSDPQHDIELFNRLLSNHHMSPFEHIGFVPSYGRITKDLHFDLQRNFRGWYQFRAFVENPQYREYLSKWYNIDINNVIK